VNHNEIVSFLWGVADLIRDTFKRGKYQDVILPLTVLRRLDCVLAPTKEKVLRKQAELRDKKLENLDPQLRRASGFAFYNTSRYDFEKLLGDAPHLATNLRNYIAGFSPNMREVVERFDFDNTISKLDESGLLFKVLERFKNVNLHPDKVDNPTMGMVFEELIRKFNEALNENPGEHFTPRDVVHLMVDLMLAGDQGRIRAKGVVRTVYDPCCGSGGMLMIAKEHITAGLRQNGDLIRPPINREAEIHLFGQEVNPETWAVSKSDLFMKDPTGRDADKIAYGSTLSNDRHAGSRYDYLIANPPYGKDWKRDYDAVHAEHERGTAGRFSPGLPRISDGQLLFLLHMLAHAREPKEGGSRIAIIMNGSPLFTGDAGSGESGIRRFVLERDLLEALIALPEQLFYNTGIATYVWVITNRKVAARRGKVQLIDATSFWVPMRKSLGDKRRTIPHDRAQDILKILADFKDGDTRAVLKDGRKKRSWSAGSSPRRTSASARSPSSDRSASTSEPTPSVLRGSRRSAGSWLSPSPRRRVPRERRSRSRGEPGRRRSASSFARYRTRCSRTVTSLRALSIRRQSRRLSSWRPRSPRLSSRPSPSATRPRPAAATTRATLSPILTSGTRRTCRLRSASRSSSNGR
jgi:type I restriction enzyme M protein